MRDGSCRSLITLMKSRPAFDLPIIGDPFLDRRVIAKVGDVGVVAIPTEICARDKALSDDPPSRTPARYPALRHRARGYYWAGVLAVAGSRSSRYALTNSVSRFIDAAPNPKPAPHTAAGTAHPPHSNTRTKAA